MAAVGHVHEVDGDLVLVCHGELSFRGATVKIVGTNLSPHVHTDIGGTETGVSLETTEQPNHRQLTSRAVEANVGAFIMLGWLFGLIVFIFGLVLRYDPEARRSPKRENGDR
jgi:hypothetical protein